MIILVTGGAGFIGTNFILNNLKKNGNKLIVYDKLTYPGIKKNFDLLENSDSFEFIKGDINNKDKLEKVLRFIKGVNIDFMCIQETKTN